MKSLIVPVAVVAIAIAVCFFAFTRPRAAKPAKQVYEAKASWSR